MILLLAVMLVILPLLILDCIKRDSKEQEQTPLPFSNEVHPPVAASTPPPKPPPLPPQPKSDGQKDTVTSTTKKEDTDKQTTATATPSRGRSTRPAPIVTRPEHQFNAFAPPRHVRKDASWRKRSPQQHYLDPLPSSQRRPRLSPEKNAQREVAREAERNQPRTPGRKRASPLGRSGVPGQLGSKMSKKSRKASQPRSPSMKEFPAIPKVAQSKTDVTTLASVKNGEANKSALTALSEYVFQESKYKILGNVDQVVENSDQVDVLNKALQTEQSQTCVSGTSRARSPYFDGQFDVWHADRVGSQAEG